MRLRSHANELVYSSAATIAPTQRLLHPPYKCIPTSAEYFALTALVPNDNNNVSILPWTIAAPISAPLLQSLQSCSCSCTQFSIVHLFRILFLFICSLFVFYKTLIIVMPAQAIKMYDNSQTTTKRITMRNQDLQRCMTLQETAFHDVKKM